VAIRSRKSKKIQDKKANNGRQNTVMTNANTTKTSNSY